MTSEPNWERLPHAVTWRIRDLLRRCMRKDRERRLRDISAARLDLEDALADPVAPVSRERPTPWPLIAMGAVVLGAGILVGAIGLWSLSERPREEVVRFTIELPPEQKLRTRGDIGLLAISADGRHMTYVAEAGDGKAGLYFRSIDDFESRFVPGTQGAERPFFSPDGEWVGFFAENKASKSSLGRRPSNDPLSSDEFPRREASGPRMKPSSIPPQRSGCFRCPPREASQSS